ncbi:hypothetical protein KUH03_13340 [Sphingobacterium sp. E70]|uniref:hypothetical protein n=1 Tax=Sphingobacterium sp. E70 TaxID=2853439 RepID=UPI00211D0383|nr:hypothetical protein [Sphingobacterium sp. E70]ULT27597.1 hypothetical protein KUH03_13340 [Sphingobacterium sp. E70]
MKNIISKIGFAVLLGGVISSCSKFEEMNVNPYKANDDQVKIEFFLTIHLRAHNKIPISLNVSLSSTGRLLEDSI